MWGRTLQVEGARKPMGAQVGETRAHGPQVCVCKCEPGNCIGGGWGVGRGPPVTELEIMVKHVAFIPQTGTAPE